MDDTASSFKIKLESTGNYRYSLSPPPQKTMFKPGWIISDPE